MIQKRKRGRPPKNKVIVSGLDMTQEPIKRKRGRPPKKAAAIGTLNLPRKRGRPKKAVSISSSPKQIKESPKSIRATNENYVAGKMFIHNRKVSKQEPWFDLWHQSYCEFRSKKDWSSVSSSIVELQKNLNKFLESHDDVKLSVHIPLTRLMQDDEIIQILFDPVNKGADIKVYFRAKDFPLGLSPSMKATAVCNKLTEIIKSWVPVGVSG